jgi:hypothetical protein
MRRSASGWADVATKHDLEQLATKADVRTEIADLRTEIADLRTEVRTTAADLRVEMSDQFRAQTGRIMGAMLPSLLGLAALMVTRPPL